MANITGTSRFLRILAERGTTGLVELVDEDLSFNGSHTIQSIGGTLTLGAFTLGGAITGASQNITGLGTTLIGSATAYGVTNGKLEVNNTSMNALVLNAWVNSRSAGNVIEFNHNASDAGVGNFTKIQSGDMMGQLLFHGADGTNWQPAAYLVVTATGTTADNRVAGQWDFHAYTDAASSVDTSILTMTAAAITWNAAVPHTNLAVVSAGMIQGLGTGANGFKLKNLKNAAASALSGTQLDIEIDIGGTPYYFTVYPTKA